MINLKSSLVKLLFTTVILFSAQSTFAAFFGWQTMVKATDFVNTYSQGVSAPTFAGCENARSIAINNYVSMGYVIISAPGCTPIPFRIPELVKWERIKWPWPGPGPVCLSCPFLTRDNLAVIYPDNVKQVTHLMQQYNIDIYNEELSQLQDKFDLEGFEAEMFKLESIQKLDSRQGNFKQ